MSRGKGVVNARTDPYRHCMRDLMRVLDKVRKYQEAMNDDELSTFQMIETVVRHRDSASLEMSR